MPPVIVLSGVALKCCVSFDTNTEAGTTAAQGPRVTLVVAEQNKRDDVDDVICKHSFAHLGSSHYHITE